MTMAQMYLNEVEMISKRYSTAAFNRNTEISTNTRENYVNQQTEELNKLAEKYSMKKTVLERSGILENVRYDFPDGSTHEVKWF